VGELLHGASRIVIYNAEYDRRLLRQTRALYGLPAFGIDPDRFECAMVYYAGYVGEWSEYHGWFRRQPLCGNHRALEDCRAVLGDVKRMAAANLDGDV
jgi:DNA polymerase-3 subunit epsilon